MDILFKSEIISEAFKRAEQLNLPNWYIGAGCIAQTVWNHFHGFDPESFINDIDLVYFDSVDLSFEAEDGFIRKAAEYFKGFSIPIDIKNQARVHLWFEDKFGYNIAPYQSITDAVKTWPTTSTTVAVRPDGASYEVYVPYGLEDLFSLSIKPNKVQITREICETKCKRWRKHWPRLKIIPWDENS